jgi:hypothetical protein
MQTVVLFDSRREFVFPPCPVALLPSCHGVYPLFLLLVPSAVFEGRFVRPGSCGPVSRAWVRG